MEWLDALAAPDRTRAEALVRLRALLLHAARSEVARRSAGLLQVPDDELDVIATEAADDALVAVLEGLDDFSGRSRFTTWARKFAVVEAGVRVRRRAWREREVALRFDREVDVGDAALGRQISRLAPGERAILIALAIDGVPIDVLAERLNTTRNALYETLHHARRQLRAGLRDLAA